MVDRKVLLYNGRHNVARTAQFVHTHAQFSPKLGIFLF